MKHKCNVECALMTYKRIVIFKVLYMRPEIINHLHYDYWFPDGYCIRIRSIAAPEICIDNKGCDIFLWGRIENSYDHVDACEVRPGLDMDLIIKRVMHVISDFNSKDIEEFDNPCVINAQYIGRNHGG